MPICRVSNSRIETRRQVSDYIVTRFVGCGGARFARGLVLDDYLCVRNHPSRRVFGEAHDGTEIRLRASGCRNKQKCCKCLTELTLLHFQPPGLFYGEGFGPVKYSFEF